MGWWSAHPSTMTRTRRRALPPAEQTINVTRYDLIAANDEGNVRLVELDLGLGGQSVTAATSTTEYWWTHVVEFSDGYGLEWYIVTAMHATCPAGESTHTPDIQTHSPRPMRSTVPVLTTHPRAMTAPPLFPRYGSPPSATPSATPSASPPTAPRNTPTPYHRHDHPVPYHRPAGELIIPSPSWVMESGHCSPCEPGKFAKAENSLACDSCSVGTYSGERASACTDCEVSHRS